jgi:chromosome segregation ATPase
VIPIYGGARHTTGTLCRVPNPEDLETRMATLEHEVARLRDEVHHSRTDAAAARVLAGGADRDIAAFGTKLEAHTKTLNALRETQLEQSQRLDRLEHKVDHLEHEMRQGFATLSAGMAQIIELLTRNDGSNESD